ncbi:P110/LppT family adhesin N-terminal domain [Mycoplasma sp. 'Moose RK']|uniref:P110/LppT family adhesin N-terminal domain n=1 Tax=Mycoplasma sp. 'Moose RK' TaxID=2780095 RepID=UPI0018C3387D|nr:P110/LppT family adhesin N-terminal domain [Mycoplasma sp. 'Moose RK']MBG0730735.1 P110/LppT family adhesin N-terminal domain [Mycoplasma sp. 'Moose RK']
MQKNTWKTWKTIIIVASITLTATIATAVPLGILSYNRSYYSKLHENPETLNLKQTENPFTNNFAELTNNLVVKDQFQKLSPKIALDLAKSQIYNLDLLTLVNLEKLYQKNYQISYDLRNASVSGGAIKGIVLFVKVANTNQVFSKAVEIKGFSTKQNLETDLGKYEIDETKSAIVVKPKEFISFPEFKEQLQNSFVQFLDSEKQKFLAFEKALLQTKGSYSLINMLGLPSFIRQGQILEPSLQGNNLQFSTKDQKQFLHFELQQNDQKSLIKLEIRGLPTQDEFKKEITGWIKENLADKIQLKSAIQTDLTAKNLSLSRAFYDEKVPNPQNFSAKNFADLFDHIEKSFSINTIKLKKYNAIVSFETQKIDKIDGETKTNLLKDDKIRLEVTVNVTKKVNSKTIKIADFTFNWDLKPDLNALSRIFAKNLPKQNAQIFSLKKAENSIALSSNKLTKIITEIKDLSKNLNPEAPDLKLVGQLYLLDFGKIGSESEISNYKSELIEIAKKVKTELVNVQNFSENSTAQQPKDDNTLGKTIWKALNLQHILLSNNVRPDFVVENNGNQFSLEFNIISNKDSSKLASTKIIINDVVSSTQSSFDVATKFFPTFFLDGKSSFSKKDEESSVYNIHDLSDNNIQFEDSYTGKNRATLEGFEIKKAIRFKQNNESEQLKVASEKTEPHLNEAPLTRLNSGVIYLAFRPKNIGDYKKHYLISDVDGKGLFIQKIHESKFVKKSRIIEAFNKGNDQKGFLLLSNSNTAEGEKEKKNLDSFVIGLDFKQVANLSAFKQYFKSKGSSYLSANIFSNSLVDKSAVILGPNSWNPPKNFAGDIVENNGSPPISAYRPEIQIANRISENRFYRQELKTTVPISDLDLQPIIDQDQTIILEIIKTPWSIKVNAFSSTNNQLNSPSTVSLSSQLIYNIDPFTQKWDPLPNFFNLDWAQIGPNPNRKSKTMPTRVASESSQESSQQDSNSSIILKALAVYNDPQLTNESSSSVRDQIKSSFIDAYLK